MSRFEVHYEITIEFDSGRLQNWSAFSKTEYLTRIRPYLQDTRVKEVRIRRVEKFPIDRFLPIGRSYNG